MDLNNNQKLILIILLFSLFLGKTVLVDPYVYRTRAQRGKNIEINVDFDRKIKLIRAKLNTDSYRPNEYLKISLFWEPLKNGLEDYSTFVHIRGPGNQWVAQSDNFYPKKNQSSFYPTSEWKMGQIIEDRHTIFIPKTTLSQGYDLLVGLYDRKKINLPIVNGLGNSLPIAKINVFRREAMPSDARTFKPPIRQEAGISLLGYKIDQARPKKNKYKLTLFWEAEKRPKKDYTVFVHCIDRNGKILQQIDCYPRKGNYPTSYWYPNSVIEDEYELEIPDNYHEKMFTIYVGMYDLASRKRLKIIGQNDDKILIEEILLAP